MIRVNRAGIPTPPDLIDPDSAGIRERDEAIAFYSNADNAAESFDYKAYKRDAVKEALNTLFRYKCAYCESNFGATQPVDIEHYRPKGAVIANGKQVKPGYYWLAAEWDNLLPSCIDCNRARNQEFVDGTSGKSGKANLFPVDNEARRARAPGEEASEGRLLLHPCRDFPDAHLEWLDEGVVRARMKAGGPSPKGVASIEVYGLQRIGLVNLRRDRLKVIQANLRLLDLLLPALDQDPDNQMNLTLMEQVMTELNRLQADDQAYLAMTRQTINDYFARL